MYRQRNSFESAAGGVHRGGRICAKRLPCADFFGYFLVQGQESNIITAEANDHLSGYPSINVCKQSVLSLE